MKNARTEYLGFIIGDIVSLELAYGLAIFLNPERMWEEAFVLYRQLGVLLAAILILVLIFADAYNDVLRRGYLKEMIAVCRQIILVFVIQIILLFVFKQSHVFSRLILSEAFLFTVPLVYVERLLIKKFLWYRLCRSKNVQTMMIIATREQAKLLIGKLLSCPLTVSKIVGLAVVDRDLRGKEILGVPVTSDENGIMDFVKSHVIDEVLISIPENSRYEEDLARNFLSIGLVVHIYMEQYFQELPNREHNQINGMDVLTCFNRRVPFWMILCKRAMDVAGGVVGSLMAVVIGLVIAPIIYIKSPGPIIFSQTRVGKNGRKFRFYKFRSMYMDAEERKKELMARNKIQGYMFKIDDDPRIIPGIGHFIRKTSLDEFPQFFNVLKGDMSLVGTRPPTVDEYEMYSFPHNKRLAMKPGITGLWQISGRSDITDFEEVVRLDSQYIDSWNIEMDIKIILKTVCLVFSQKGSA